MFKKIAQLLIHLYRLVISPLIGPCCRFQPSCSRYALQAVERHGVWRGGLLSIARILRCQPLCRHHGYDPVPERFTWAGLIGYNHRNPDTNAGKRQKT